MKKRVLITGAAGMLGSDVMRVFSENYILLATDKIPENGIQKMDVRDYNQCKEYFENFIPDLVLHLAAETDLEQCEQRSKDCIDTNSYGTENIAMLCDKYNADMVYISTAGVFSGDYMNQTRSNVQDSQGRQMITLKPLKYSEIHSANALNLYGHSKYVGEQLAKERTKRLYIIRAGWMFGGGKKDKKFVKKIIAQRDQKTIHAVIDKFGTPTYTLEFARMIEKVSNSGMYGTYHGVCEGDCVRRYDVAKEILSLIGSNAELIQSNSEHFKKEYFVSRAMNESMENTKLEFHKIYKMRDWKECLAEYINEKKDELMS